MQIGNQTWLLQCPTCVLVSKEIQSPSCSTLAKHVSIATRGINVSFFLGFLYWWTVHVVHWMGTSAELMRSLNIFTEKSGNKLKICLMWLYLIPEGPAALLELFFAKTVFRSSCVITNLFIVSTSLKWKESESINSESLIIILIFYKLIYKNDIVFYILFWV